MLFALSENNMVCQRLPSYQANKIMKLSLIKALAIILVAALYFSIYQLMKSERELTPNMIQLPTVEQLNSFLDGTVHTDVRAMTEVMKNIRDAESAREALPEILTIGDHIISTYQDIPKHSLSLSNEEAGITCFKKLMAAEENHYQTHEACYDEFYGEYQRLKTAHFYGVPSLSNLFCLYFIAEAGDKHLLLWFPGSRLRMLAQKQDIVSNEAFVCQPPDYEKLRRVLRNLAENVDCCKGRDEYWDLLLLDMCHHARISSYRNGIFHPYGPIIKSTSNNALFELCFCDKFCLREPQASTDAVCPMHGVPLHALRPEDICHLAQSVWRTCPEYSHTENHSHNEQTVILRLQPPFLSKYLHIGFLNDELISIYFTNET